MLAITTFVNNGVIAWFVLSILRVCPRTAPSEKIHLEPTYRIEPTGKIPVDDINVMMRRETEDLLQGLKYSLGEAPSWSKVIHSHISIFGQEIVSQQ